MATPRESYHEDDIVISGISGAFPNSDNFEEFKENLLKGENMFSTSDKYGETHINGVLKTIDRFDHTFFHINRHDAEGVIIGSRLLLEKTFEAVLDAGYNLQKIKGKNIAVVCGIWDASTENDPAFEAVEERFTGSVGTGQYMCANRISSWLDLHGPSCSVNTACSSSMYALDMAIKYIQNDHCEGAIVGSVNFIFGDGGMTKNSAIIHSTKISSPFDAQAGGYIRSEAVVVMFLQKRKYARRIYANVIHLTTNCDGYKAEGIAHPSITQQKKLYEKFYKTINIDPRSISYIEAHGTGTQVGDVVEGTSIAEFFCQGRETPLKLGSVKSNIGHTESAAALCGITKLIAAFESGIIPANQHFTSPNPSIKGLLNGQLQIVTVPTPADGRYFAINSFGIGGANGHLLLSPHNKIKQSAKSKCEDDIPRILTVSGRTEEAIDCIFNDPNVTIFTSRDQVTEIQVPNEINVSNEKLPNDKSSSIIVLSDISHKMDMIESIHGALKEDGFLITREPAAKAFNTYKKLGFNVCFSRKINETERILLLNKVVRNESVYKTVEVTSNTFVWVSNVQNELAAVDPGRNEKLVIYAEKDPRNGILGFFNTLRKEEKGKNLRCVYTMDEKVQDFSLEHSFYRDQLDTNLCQNVYKNGQWGVYCHITTDQVDEIETTHALCVQEERGDFSSFKWIERSPNLQEFENFQKNHIYVYYSSLNFRDVMITSGRISAEDLPTYNRLTRSHYGFEFSGKDDNGTRWMGIVEKEAIATTVQSRPETTWKIPDHMTLEEAATIPVIYATVVIAFFFKMSLQKGCSVLIHAGSGGIGQAAINICLHYKCEIFTTVGTPEKVQFIRKTFPQIPESHIGNSRDTSFEQLIIQQTNGRGVDVVLNSLAEEKMQASVRCLAYDGHFLEIGKYDMLERHDLSLGHFVNNISFHSIQLDLIMRTNRYLTLAIKEKVTEFLNQGIIKPIQRTVFQADEIESAFRFMATGKHTGKVLIKINDEENDQKGKPIPIARKCKPQVHCSKYSSYVIEGGLGGIGMELADWLILRGARNIILSSRSGIKNGYQSYRIKLWRSYGVKIVTFTEDVTNEKGVRNLLQTANTLGPVEGIFNLAMILKDDPFVKQSKENFSITNGPKAILTMHLDNLSRKMCPYLKYFIVFSSAVSGLGNQNQSNYAYANSAMERICEIRHKDSLPSLAIQWGAVGDVGIVAEFQEHSLGSEIIICGALQQKMKSCLNTLNMFMKQTSHPIVTSIVVAEKRHSEINIAGAVANVLGIKDLKAINQSWTFSELGMDSVLALELKQILELEFNAIFSPEDLQTMTFAKLYQMKKEKENTIITGEKIKTQMQTFMEEIFLNKSICRIPVDENNIEKYPTIFMFPGVEGLAVTMQSLAKNLPGQVICFQYYFGEVADYSFEELRDYFAKYILENFNSNREFCLIGHSLGGLIALEAANILEEQGKKGYVYLIESSPTYFQKRQTREDNFYDEEMQIRVCSLTMSVFLPTTPREEFIGLIKKTIGWPLKKKLCLSLLSSGMKNKNALDVLLDRIYNATKALRTYQISRVSLKSYGILIRCVENPLDTDNAYGFSEYFKHPIQIHKIDAGHTTILHHPKTLEILLECSLWKN